MFKKIVVRLTLIISLLFGTLGQVPALAADTVDAKAGLVVDAQSGQILFDQASDKVLPIGSMTKLLTVYMTLKAVKQGKISWDTEVPVSNLAYELTKDTELTNVPLEKGGHYTVRDLYHASLIQSANSAAMLLGDAFAGSQTAAVDQMRQQLKAWGIKHAEIVNTSGLNNSYLDGQIYPGSKESDENKLSAQDMAIIAQHLLKDFPKVLQTTKKTSLPFASGTSTATTLQTWNFMLPGQAAADAKLPVDGLKTGTTELAGACFTGTVKKNGRRIISVIMHANQGETDEKARFTETAKMMNQVYEQQSYHQVARGQLSGKPKQLAVKYGTQSHVKVGLAKAVGVWLPKGQATPKLSYHLGTASTLSAPVKKGTKVGHAKLRLPSTVRYLPGQQPKKTAVTTQSRVAKLSGFDLFKAQLSNLF